MIAYLLLITGGIYSCTLTNANEQASRVWSRSLSAIVQPHRCRAPQRNRSNIAPSLHKVEQAGAIQVHKKTLGRAVNTVSNDWLCFADQPLGAHSSEVQNRRALLPGLVVELTVANSDGYVLIPYHG